jgi:hypothetical protein
VIKKIEISTVNGPVYPQKISTAELYVEGPDGRPVRITTENTLYIPSYPSNILSSHQLYNKDGWINRYNVIGPDEKVLTKLRFSKTEFYLRLAKTPKLSNIALMSRPTQDKTIATLDSTTTPDSIQSLEPSIEPTPDSTSSQPASQPADQSTNNENERKVYL